MSRIVFIHLSEIHFHYRWSGNAFDRDDDIRNELENDLRTVIGRAGSAVGVIVSGDIAYHGDRREFEFAKVWLNRIAGIADCEATNVLTIPGNHDIQRGVVQAVSSIRQWQKEICCDGNHQSMSSCLQGKHQETNAGGLTQPCSLWRS